MLEAVRKDLAAWAASGPWWKRAIKTALNHTIVWVGATVLGGAVGAVAVLLDALAPFLAIGFPLLGYSLGQKFYVDREFLGEDPDVEKEGWRAKVDAFLDYVVPWVLATAVIYGVVVVYPLL